MTPAAQHAAWLREVGQLRPNNHELWRYLQRRVNDPVPMARIAAELGLDVDALCVWMLSYTGPKHKPYQSKNGTPIGKVKAHMPMALARPAEPAVASSVRVFITPREQEHREKEAVSVAARQARIGRAV